jgi:putative tricarboxylic transport membrane protein
MSKFRTGTSVGLEYIFSPIVMVLIVVTVISIFVGIRQAKAIMSEGQVPIGGKRAPLIFLICVTAYFVISYFNAAAITIQTDRIFPMTISFVATAACVALLVRTIRAPGTDTVFADREASGEDAEAPHGLWGTMAWFGALLVLSSLLGFILALGLFLVTFIRIRAQCSWVKTLVLTAGGIALICFMAGMLHRDFPPGLLQTLVDLPWPLGGI